MKTKEARELTREELELKYRDLLKEQFDLRKMKVTGKLDDPLKLRHIRRDIARALTILNEKQPK